MKNFIKKKSLFGFILLLLAIGVTNAQMGIGTDDSGRFCVAGY